MDGKPEVSEAPSPISTPEIPSLISLPLSDDAYRLRLQNLPSNLGIGQLKEFLAKLGLCPSKVKKNPQWNFAFLSFKTDEEKLTALETLKKSSFKNRSLRVEIAPACSNNNSAKRPRIDGDAKSVADLDPKEALLDKVTPLWRLPYEQQLLQKGASIRKTLLKMAQAMKKFTVVIDKEFCPFDGVKASPIVNGYRNKCEFAIGNDSAGKRMIGFMKGAYKEGTVSVADPSDCPHVSPAALELVRRFMPYIEGSDKEVFSRISHEGCWRLFVVRTLSSGQNLVVVQMHPQKLSPEELRNEKEKLADFFRARQGENGVSIDGLLFQTSTNLSTGFLPTACDVLFGSEFVHEKLLGLQFRISPQAFFQSNTPAAEVLYRTIQDFCGALDQASTTVLDLCCGTGTIGLSLASQVRHVVGIELNEDAVKDAIVNARLNNLENVEFIAARVQDVIDSVLKRAKENGSEIVAVLDPPRSGLPADVIKSIRRCEDIKRLVYVACDLDQSMNNIIDLCRPSTNTMQGQPFAARQATSVDLFPHTDHYEVVIALERG